MKEVEYPVIGQTVYTHERKRDDRSLDKWIVKKITNTKFGLTKIWLTISYPNPVWIIWEDYINGNEWCDKCFLDKIYLCPDCGGDGIETCHNPDHSFITALDFHEVGRLGCPCCGHDTNFKMNGKCYTCSGIGLVSEEDGNTYLDDMGIDETLEIFNTPQTDKG